MTGFYHISHPKMTVGVTVEDGIITEAPPVVRKFIGQPLDNLIGWIRSPELVVTSVLSTCFTTENSANTEPTKD